MAENHNLPEEKQQEEVSKEIQIQRIYIKDVSFEAPNLPQVFQQEWEPKVSFSLNTATNELGDDLYEVVLHINIETKLEKSEDTAFLCEIQQAGIFLVKGLKDLELAHCLAAQCPSILYPYARELISSLVNRGTFPQLNLAPVNFDELFVEYLQK